MSNVSIMEMPRVATWEKIGTNVKMCKNDLGSILKESNLDYTVESKPVYIGDSNEPSSKYHAIVRSSDGHVYNVAKNSYTICQNEEAFSLINELDDSVEVVRAGETQSGLIYMIAKMPEVTVLGDSFTPHLIFQNSHTADFALKTAIVPLRVACQNQFSIAFPEANNTQTIKHTSSIGSQIAEMNETLLHVKNYMDAFNNRAEMLVKNRVDVNKILDILFPENEEMTDRQILNRENARNLFLKAYNNDDNSNFKGTAWGILNAATDYATHNEIRKGGEDGQFIRTVIYPEFTNNVMKLLQAA